MGPSQYRSHVLFCIGLCNGKQQNAQQAFKITCNLALVKRPNNMQSLLCQVLAGKDMVYFTSLCGLQVHTIHTHTQIQVLDKIAFNPTKHFRFCVTYMAMFSNYYNKLQLLGLFFLI